MHVWRFIDCLSYVDQETLLQSTEFWDFFAEGNKVKDDHDEE